MRNLKWDFTCIVQKPKLSPLLSYTYNKSNSNTKNNEDVEKIKSEIKSIQNIRNKIKLLEKLFLSNDLQI